MAFVVTPDEKAPQAQGAQAIASPTSTGGAGTAGAAKATTKAANTPGVNSPAQPPAQLSAYLNANQQQAMTMAGNVSNTVGGQINAAGQAILPAVNTYTGQLTNVAPDSALNTQLTNSPASLTADQQAAYQKELNADAQKPNSAATFETTQAYGDLTGNIQKATEQASLWNAGSNVAQLQTAFTPFEGANATTGDRQLDALILSQTPGAYSQIQSAVAPAATLQDQLTQATTQANTGLKTAIANDTASTQAAQQAAQTYAKNLTDYLNKAQTSALNANTTNQSIMQDLQKGNLSDTDLGLLGLNRVQWNELNAPINLTGNGAVSMTPANLAQYLQLAQAQNTNIPQIASQQNYSDVAALLSMLGENAGSVNLPINPSTASQAGTVQPGTATFKYNDAMTAAQNVEKYDSRVKQYLDTAKKDMAEIKGPAKQETVIKNLGEIRYILNVLDAMRGEGENLARIVGGKFQGIDTSDIQKVSDQWAASGGY